MTTRIIENDRDREDAIRLIHHRELPITVKILKGKKRTPEQNRLQRQWINEISEQLGDRTPEEVRAYCKLHIGIAILKNDDADFSEKYDRIIKPHTYEEKLEMMAEPFDFPVTRLMTTKQKAQYLDEMHRHFSGLGVVLADPGQDAQL